MCIHSELKSESERLFFAGRDDDEAAVMVQRVGLGCHGLDGDAHAVGRGVHLDGVVLLVAGFLPDVDGETVAFELYVRVTALVGEAEAVVDEFVSDFAAAHEARVFLEVAGGEVGAIQEREVRLGEREGEPVDFFAEHKVRMPAFGIRHVFFAGVLDAGGHGDGFAGKDDGVRRAEGERETGEGAGPVAGENGGAAFAIAFETFEFPFLVLQESVQGVRGPAYVVD